MADVTFSDSNFESDVLKSTGPVLVDFWAPWCTPCKIVGPIIEELATDYAGKLKVGKMDVDQNPDTASQYGVMSIPSVVLFKNGQPVKTLVGAQGKPTYKQAIDEVLA
jgi:thioredoxin 1